MFYSEVISALAIVAIKTLIMPTRSYKSYPKKAPPNEKKKRFQLKVQSKLLTLRNQNTQP
jgi:hypothetical protein